MYGILPCDKCQERQEKLKRPDISIEFTTEDIKQQRKQYAKDIVQMHRGGKLSKEWLDIYGAKSAKKHGFTDNEIKHAKNVWSGDTPGFYYNDDK